MFRVLLAVALVSLCNLCQADESDAKRTEAELGVFLGPAEPSGAIVTRVNDGSSAAGAGLRVRDRIVKINDVEIKTQDDVIRTIQSLMPGQTIKVEIMRGDKKELIDVKLGHKREPSRTTDYDSHSRQTSFDDRNYRRPTESDDRFYRSQPEQLVQQIDRLTELLEELRYESVQLRSGDTKAYTSNDGSVVATLSDGTRIYTTTNSGAVRALPSPPPILTPALKQSVSKPQTEADRLEQPSEELVKYPVFQLPAPEPHSHCEIPANFWRTAKPERCGDVENYLRTALTGANYYDVGTLLLPQGYDGFALVTPPEQTTAAGVPEADNIRWNTEVKPLADEGFSFGKYAKGVFLTRPGYFRSFVFIFSAHPIQTTEKTTTKVEVTRWKRNSITRLPAAVARRPITENHQLEVLVYEFTQEDKGRAVTLREHPMAAKTHLEKTGLWDKLDKHLGKANGTPTTPP